MQVVDRVKIMVHHPRIIFPEAELEVDGEDHDDGQVNRTSEGSFVHWTITLTTNYVVWTWRMAQAAGRSRRGLRLAGAAAGAAVVVRGLGVATYVREVRRSSPGHH